MSGQLAYTGSDLVAAQSAKAISTLLRELGTLGKLRAAFGTSNASIESCAATATVVMEKISPHDFVGGRLSVHVKGSLFKKASSMPMSAQAVIAEIMRLLDAPNAVYINIANDHHFVTLPIDDDRMAIVQGFQGSYTLIDWFEWRGIGMLMKGEFKAALTQLLTSDSQPTWTEGAQKLFSFNLAKQAPGGTGRSKQKVAQDISDWFSFKPYVKAYGYKPL